MKKILTGILVLFLAITVSCDFGGKYEREEKQLIQEYLGSVGDTVYIKTASGLYYFIVSEGTGRTPVNGDTVYIWYKAKYLTGQLFDMNLENTEPFGFIVGTGSVIKGIDEGVKLMKDGSIFKLVTPSDLAYGPNGLYGYDQYGYYVTILPGYTPLVWDIEIDTVMAGSK
ncbi:MAG: FKBP-type peptidyl-prolyl cis-trans isomerase [Bacteroidales bacterium]